MIERRMAERETLALSVEYDLGATAGEIGERPYRAEAQDICVDGLQIITEYPLTKGAILRLNYPKNGPRTHIPVFAEVAWAGRVGDRFRAGLRFLR
jgi:hypothetical protein